MSEQKVITVSFQIVGSYHKTTGPCVQTTCPTYYYHVHEYQNRIILIGNQNEK